MKLAFILAAFLGLLGTMIVLYILDKNKCSQSMLVRLGFFFDRYGQLCSEDASIEEAYAGVSQEAGLKSISYSNPSTFSDDEVRARKF